LKAISRLKMKLRLIDQHFDYSTDFSNNLLVKDKYKFRFF